MSAGWTNARHGSIERCDSGACSYTLPLLHPPLVSTPPPPPPRHAIAVLPLCFWDICVHFAM